MQPNNRGKKKIYHVTMFQSPGVFVIFFSWPNNGNVPSSGVMLCKRSNTTRQKNEKGGRKKEPNDSPEITDGGWGVRGTNIQAFLPVYWYKNQMKPADRTICPFTLFSDQIACSIRLSFNKVLLYLLFSDRLSFSNQITCSLRFSFNKVSLCLLFSDGLSFSNQTACSFRFPFKPFTAPSCTIYGLKDACTRLQIVYFPVL